MLAISLVREIDPQHFDTLQQEVSNLSYEYNCRAIREGMVGRAIVNQLPIAKLSLSRDYDIQMSLDRMNNILESDPRNHKILAGVDITEYAVHGAEITELVEAVRLNPGWHSRLDDRHLVRRARHQANVTSASRTKRKIEVASTHPFDDYDYPERDELLKSFRGKLAERVPVIGLGKLVAVKFDPIEYKHDIAA